MGVDPKSLRGIDQEMRQSHLSTTEGGNRAAAYVRMSTEHQQYSTENQLDAIRVYAAAHELEIVRVYTDAGKSGLSLDGREALQQLLRMSTRVSPSSL